ncbi:Crp/Fnr family transcriptional regulator [Hoeflea sp. WL0058]|uniref:Crp/Fnr family transcriptional regulator n=1 Tax=Flavimaribacter sediminis TaxID=2865987 RepID=A0AAE2ZSH4_9HYPH|nr:Crp/Fnr family transcriptional regulator [Flavimaribacter sediminis]
MDQNTIAAIRSCYLFAGADQDSVAALARSSRIVSYPAGSTIFMEGDESDGLRVVLSGLTRIWIADADGRELTLALMEPGDPFGEIALLDGLPRTANATVIEATECLFTSQEVMVDLLVRDPRLARHLIQLLCEILRRNTEALSGFAFLGLDGRLAQRLHELALAHAEIEGSRARFTRKFSQTDLAQMLGVTREALNKRLKTLVHDGLVKQANGMIAIPNLAALAARAKTAEKLANHR